MKKLLTYFLILFSLIIIGLNTIRLDKIFMDYFHVDFSAYFSAALAKVHGENPYSYTLQTQDGARFEHSEYLQPPIVADFFIPFAYFPYSIAKQAWCIIQVALFFLCILLLTRKLYIALPIIALSLATMPLLFWPFFIHLELGQTDIVVLFFICLSYFFTLKKKFIPAGIFLAIAGIFKMPAFLLFVIPFLMKEKKFLLSGLVTFCSLILFSIIFDGFLINQKYVTEYLPAIINTSILPINTFDISSEQQNLMNGFLSWEGIKYKASIDFICANGSFLRFIQSNLGKMYGTISSALGILIAIISGWFYSKRIIKITETDTANLSSLLWPFLMISILIFHPMTWLMNYVWIYSILLMIIPFWKNKQLKLPIIIISFFTFLLSLSDRFVFLAQKNIMEMTHNHLSELLNFIIGNRIWMGGVIIWLIFLMMIIIPINEKKNNEKIETT